MIELRSRLGLTLAFLFLLAAPAFAQTENEQAQPAPQLCYLNDCPGPPRPAPPNLRLCLDLNELVGIVLDLNSGVQRRVANPDGRLNQYLDGAPCDLEKTPKGRTFVTCNWLRTPFDRVEFHRRARAEILACVDGIASDAGDYVDVEHQLREQTSVRGNGFILQLASTPRGSVIVNVGIRGRRKA